MSKRQPIGEPVCHVAIWLARNSISPDNECLTQHLPRSILSAKQDPTFPDCIGLVLHNPKRSPRQVNAAFLAFLLLATAFDPRSSFAFNRRGSDASLKLYPYVRVDGQKYPFGRLVTD